MNRNSQKLRDLLLKLINKQKQDLTGLISDSDVNFTRNRKIPYENMILSLLTMEGAALTNELLRQFGCSTTTEKERQSNYLELQTLIYQINPHFLYNTLDSINMLIFVIEDTGKGMDEDTLSKLYQKINEKKRDEKENRGYGIWNVNQRIKLFYGEQYGLQIDSIVDKGTSIYIKIPAEI